VLDRLVDIFVCFRNRAPHELEVRDQIGLADSLQRDLCQPGLHGRARTQPRARQRRVCQLDRRVCAHAVVGALVAILQRSVSLHTRAFRHIRPRHQQQSSIRARTWIGDRAIEQSLGIGGA